MENNRANHKDERPIMLDARIMIVDDQEANTDLLEGILKREGYTNLVCITDPRQVVPSFMEASPDLVLLDLMMPYLSGFDVLQQLKPLIPEDTYLPILVLTADVTTESKRLALAIGANDFLTKPFDRVEVLLRINALLRTRSLHLELQQQKLHLEEIVQLRTQALVDTLEQVETAQETERHRLSMDMHDGPLQSLGVCTMAVDRAIRLHERGNSDLMLKELHDLRVYLNGTIDELRGVLADLSLDILTHYGLEAALRDFISHTSRFSDSIAINLNITLSTNESDMLPPKTQLLMYRLAQEALTNVRKHSAARNVELLLELEASYLHMRITDDGVGFDSNAELNEHYAGVHIGLRSMLERIEKAHGHLDISSAPGKGTILSFRSPLQSRPRQGKQITLGTLGQLHEEFVTPNDAI